MGERERFHSSVHHQTVYRKRRSPCMQRPKKQSTSHNLVWVPKIPSWEKEFCYKIGLFTWKNFLEAKKLTGYSHKILQWNDSAAEEAFHRSKNRFYAMINGLPNPDESNIPGPDSYIDEIHWDDSDGVNSELLDGVGSAVDEREEEEEDENHDYVLDYYPVAIEDIKPTGWNVDVEERGNGLTGLIVGC